MEIRGSVAAAEKNARKFKQLFDDPATNGLVTFATNFPKSRGISHDFTTDPIYSPFRHRTPPLTAASSRT
jgi:hypothetical protein